MEMHNIETLKEVINSVYASLKQNYGFLDLELLDGTSSESFLSIVKNEVVICHFIDIREGMDLSILRKGDSYYQRKGLNSFTKPFYPMFSDERKAYYEEQKKALEGVPVNSNEYYSIILRRRIDFLIANYPSMFDKGELPLSVFN